MIRGGKLVPAQFQSAMAMATVSSTARTWRITRLCKRCPVVNRVGTT